MSDPHWVLWAKLPRGSNQPSTVHPLLCHLVDVAMVARAMWQDVLSPAARSRVAAALGIEEDAAGRWVAFWAGAHDLGKGCPSFALQNAAARARIVAAGFPCPSLIPRALHGTVTASELPGILTSDFGLSGDLAARVGAVVGGHHGVFPTSAEVSDLRGDAVGKGRWPEARRALALALADVVGVSRNAPPRQIDNATAMLLAGFVSVADWIGSNTDYFPHAVQDASAMPRIVPAEYAQRAAEQARTALQRLGWTGWTPPTEVRSFASLFPHAPHPNPMQQEIVALVEALDGPSLVVVEAPMGEGKTEAAMYLADRWSVALGQRGCYFALPTQATSNQMFGRVRSFLAERYPTDVVNLQLLHGHAALSAEFAALRQADARLFQPQGVYGEPGYAGAPAQVVAAEWFTHRKRGLLAPFGVGTVDQTLLAVLQTRHVFVRLFGLAHKTVIVDEVHAYDTYMTTLLERLLEWLAALGASVVLLSATLPGARRAALVEAYARGLGQPLAEALPQAPYPRITWASRSGAGAQHATASVRASRVLHLEWVDGRLPAKDSKDFPLGQRLKAALANGGCAAVICNTVDRAQRVYQALQSYLSDKADDDEPELDLLHARFLFEERERRERRALVRFGKPGGEVVVGEGEVRPVRRPYRAVLVATQIVEQSLDLDFDLMVTDMAPVDLVLQRTGRLQRHDRPRPPGLEQPTLWLCRLEEADGVPRFGPGTEAVYDGHVLLRSWLVLKDRDTIRIPDEVEELIEAVYDDQRPCPDGLAEALRRRWEETRKRHHDEVAADTQEAQQRWLKPPTYGGALWRLTGDPREEDTPEFHQAHQALTRLAEPTVALVCLYGTHERPCFDPGGLHHLDPRAAPGLELAKRLLRRSISVSDRRVVFVLMKEEAPQGWRQSALLRHHRLLVLDGTGSATVGRCRVRLDEDAGLIITQENRR